MRSTPIIPGGVLLGVFLILGGAIVYWVYSRPDPALTGLAPSSARSLPSLPPRLILRGPPLSGDGGPDFMRAVLALADVSEEELDLLGAVKGEEAAPGPSHERLNTLMTRFEPAVQELGRALSCEKLVLDTSYPLDKPLLSAGQVLSGLAAFKHQLGRDREAMDLLLVTLQASLECQYWEPWISSARSAETMALEGWRSILSGYALSTGDLEELAGSLDRLTPFKPDLLHFSNLEEQRIRDLLESPAAVRDFAKATGWKAPTPLHSPEAARKEALQLLNRMGQAMNELAQRPSSRWIVEGVALSNRTYGVAGKLFMIPLVNIRGELELMAQWALAGASTRLAWCRTATGNFPLTTEDLVPRYLPKIPLCPLSGTSLRTSGGKLWFLAEDGIDNGGEPFDYETRTGTPPKGDLVWKVSPRP